MVLPLTWMVYCEAPITVARMPPGASTMGAGGPGLNDGTVEVVACSGTGGLSTLRGHGDVHADIRNGTVATVGLDFTCAEGH